MTLARDHSERKSSDIDEVNGASHQSGEMNIPRFLADEPLYQVDQNITRPELVGAHTKWLYCSGAFWFPQKSKCENKQLFVPSGYWFETGRPYDGPKKCSELTGDDATVVKCRFKKGKTMVLPAVNLLYYGCDANGDLEDPRLGVSFLMGALGEVKFVKATLDGTNVDPLDAITVVTQDGDGDYKLEFGSANCAADAPGIDYVLNEGCPLYAAGPYVFISTKNLSKGKHTLILIGEGSGEVTGAFCSAVKHEFTLF